MRPVSIIGVGMIPFGKCPGKDTAELAGPAILEAMQDAGTERQDIGIAYCGSVYGGMMIGQRTLARLGMTGKPILNVENACSSSSSAFHQAHMAVASGAYDVALVFGVDKLSQFGGGTIPLVDEDWEISKGMLMPALYAMRACRYMFETGLTAEQLAGVSVKARAHGARNSDAQFQKEVSLEEVMNARPIADPFTLLHCCPTGDGAAAAIICAAEIAHKYEATPVKVLASELCTGTFVTGYRDMTVPEITVRGAKEAYGSAGVGPEDIDVAEIHDAFSIAELLYYEAFGFCGRGEAIGLLEDGVTSLGGAKPVNPSGGLLSKGHPVGATGVAQITEIVRQLRGMCGPRQVDGARTGMAHATGGGAMGMDHGACSIHILQS
jgi:benzoylsuccinyl-CoA thiolase BbsB subunit